MKKTIYYLLILFSCSFAQTSWGQGCPCNPIVYLTQDPANPCCYQVNIDFGGGGGCGAVTNFNQITVNTNIGGGTGVITGASGTGSFTATFNATLATFSTGSGFIPGSPLTYVVGTVCFSNVNGGFFPAQMIISNGPNDPCAVMSFHDDLSTSCVPCSCKPVLQLAPDPANPCCYQLSVAFPNPAACNLPSGFNQITVTTGGTGIISSATPVGPYTLGPGTPTVAIFNTAPDIFPSPSPTQVGYVCFQNYSTASFPVQLVVSNGNLTPDPCAQSFSYPAVTPCPRPCTNISIADASVCTNDIVMQIPLVGCSNVCGLTQVKWYVRNSSPPGPWVLYQIKNDCSPLVLLPNQYNSDLDVYAEVLTTGVCDCPLITSAHATIHFCEPVACTISNPNAGLCYMGTPLVSGPLVLTTVPALPTCGFTVQWYQNGVLINGATLPTYTPTNLVYQVNGASDCYFDYVFSAFVTSSCGTETCTTLIRVYDGNADKGKIEMDPVEAQPFCLGEDATLKFTPGCAGDPKMWEWWRRPCVGGTATQLTPAGTMNALYNTNRLYNSWYYYVKTTNGSCPFDTVQLKIEVKEPLFINSFTAIPDPCVEQQVALTLNFNPCRIEGCGTNCSCSFTIDWYKDGDIIATTSSLGPQATHTNFILPLAGNYYAVLKDDCCLGDSIISQVIPINPTCVPLIKGPCFICNGVPVVLEGCMVLPPRDPCPDVCTYYSWCELINGVCGPILGNGLTITATHAGTYQFTSTCNGCIKSDIFVLPACTNLCACGTLKWATFSQKWGLPKPITCNNAAVPVLAPCPKQGRNYLIHGDFTCAPNSCGNNTVTWELIRPFPLPPITGVSNSLYPHFDVSLPWNQCVTAGIYTLKISRFCGIVPCSCSFTFEVPPNCPCDCAALGSDVNQGLGFNIGGSGFNNCSRKFKPFSLDPCDVVTWSVNGSPIAGSSVGNNSFSYTFPGTGLYTVCMTVTRKQIDGTICTATRCRKIFVNCGIIWHKLCPATALLNGNFADTSLIPGHLGADGSIPNWLRLPNSGDGLVFVEDSAGCYDDGYLVFSGAENNIAAVYQKVNLISNTHTGIEYNRANFGGEDLPSGTKLEFWLYEEPMENSNHQLIYSDPIPAGIDTGWVEHSVWVPITPNADYEYLVVTLTNEDGTGAQSVIGLDNLEICTFTSAVIEPGVSPIFRLFPNPTNNQLTVEWSGYDGKNGSIEIVSSIGQQLRSIPVPDGSSQIVADVSVLPEGIYFVKILSSGRLLKVLKFVKS